MIEFQKVRWQNFMSYGNQWTEISLNKNKNTLVIGKNGSGKSTLLDAITFAMFGKPYRNINKPQLVNSITDKNCLVEIEFQIGKKVYMIRRGLKPSIFEIFQDGELIKQDSLVKDYQTVLENTILKMNYKSFCQIVVLGSSDYIPFMKLKTHERRGIVEDLLDLQVFSSMNVILKERVSVNKDDLSEVEQKQKIIKSNLSLHESHLKSIQTDIAQQAKELKSKIKQESSELKVLQTRAEQLQKQITNTDDKISEFDKFETMKLEVEDYISKCDSSDRKVQKEMDFYETSCSCPTCKQDIQEEFKQTVLDKCQKVLDKNKENREKAQGKLKKIEEKLSVKSTLQSKKQSLEVEYNSISPNIYAKQKLIESFRESYNQLETKFENVDTSKKHEFEAKLSEIEQTKKALIEQKEVLVIAAQLLKDGGIKTIIIKQYVPVMNKIINQYLSHMNFFIEFSLDDNFQETIKSRHRDEFSYSSFSEGEKSRIDLAILFAWRAIAKMRNTAATNILIFDEIFDGSLDNDGTDDFMKILNTLTGDTNVFIISHKTDNISDKFDATLKFDKVKNFSRMEVL